MNCTSLAYVLNEYNNRYKNRLRLHKVDLKLTDSTRIHAHWCLRLSEYAFDVVRRAGIKRQAAEALSRLQTTGEDPTLPEKDFPVLAIDVTEN